MQAPIMKMRFLSALSVFAFAVTMSAQWSAQNDIPAFHDARPTKTAKLAPQAGSPLGGAAAYPGS